MSSINLLITHKFSLFVGKKIQPPDFSQTAVFDECLSYARNSLAMNSADNTTIKNDTSLNFPVRSLIAT